MTTSVPPTSKPKTRHDVFDALGKAVDGLSYTEVLGILSAFVGTVIESMPPELHEQTAMVFYQSISRQPDSESVQ